jgi:outer membrane protein OmpA-like peptidoglycan-associated protein
MIRVQLTPDDIAAFTGDPLIATLDVIDEKNQEAQAQDVLQVVLSSVSRERLEDAGDAQIERYQLILFDFNDVTVSATNASLLALIRSRIKPSTQVRIIGTTDVLGSSEYNADLSLRRAREVARQLQVPSPIIVGMGESEARFDNGVPEGRAYNRTVIIELVHTAK